jgi:hypothetical protein
MSSYGRRGATVAELAIALLLAGVAAALGAGILLAAERRSRRDGDDGIAAQVTRDVLHVLGAEIAAARWDAIIVRGDTALELQAHVGVSVACVAAGDVLVLPSSTTSLGDPYSVWRSPPEVGDVIVVWDTAGTGAWFSTPADSVSSVASGAGCVAGGPFRSLADSLAQLSVTRVRLTASLPAGVAPGAPVRVFRLLRWMLYRGGDGRWWLGQRRCSISACGSAQPVAGPLASPADSGLAFIDDADGGVVVSVRAERRASMPPVVRREFTIRGFPRASP